MKIYKNDLKVLYCSENIFWCCCFSFLEYVGEFHGIDLSERRFSV